jgi:DNA-binding winged helix-turn-helix (wHTH) protein
MDKSTVTLTFDSHSHLLRCSNGSEAVLSPHCASLLTLLIKNANHVVTRQTITDAVWHGRHVCDDNINHTVSRLRAKLAKMDGARSWRIETIPSVGYRLVQLHASKNLSLRLWISESITTIKRKLYQTISRF